MHLIVSPGPGPPLFIRERSSFATLFLALWLFRGGAGLAREEEACVCVPLSVFGSGVSGGLFFTLGGGARLCFVRTQRVSGLLCFGFGARVKLSAKWLVGAP